MSNYFTQHNNGGGWGDGIYQTINFPRQSTGGKEQEQDNTASAHVFLHTTSAMRTHDTKVSIILPRVPAARDKCDCVP